MRTTKTTRMRTKTKRTMSNLFSITLILPAGLDDRQAGCFLACVDDDALSSGLVRDLKIGNAWRLSWLVETAPDPVDLEIRRDLAGAMAGLDTAVTDALAWVAENLDPSINWLQKSYNELAAFAVGPFYIYGSHHDADPDFRVPAGQIGLLIDAATAFGSGQHGTTAGCMEALASLPAAPHRVLDVGTGSGILAIAAQKLWPAAAVTATDNDPEAVRVAAVHARANKLPDGTMNFICAEGFDDDAIVRGGPYDLIIANILAPPLKDMAADLCGALAPGGTVILSGILAEQQADEVQAVYESCGVKAVNRLIRTEWATLILRKV